MEEPDPSGPSFLETLEEWKKRTASHNSNDALVPVVASTLDAIGALVKPDGSRREFDRSLSSMALLRGNSLVHDERRDVGIRPLVYGMVECVHRTLLELDRNGFQPGWAQPSVRVKREPVEVEEPDEYPLFASTAEVKTERPEAMDEEETAGRSRRYSLARSTFDYDTGDFEESGGEDREDELSDFDNGSRLARRRASSRASVMSLPEADDGNGGEAVVKKKRRTSTTIGSIRCVQCDWSANSPGTVISHLRVKHSTTTTASRVYFRCQCGFDSRSNNHKSCANPKYTLIKESDEKYTPKRAKRSVQRKGKGKTDDN